MGATMLETIKIILLVWLIACPACYICFYPILKVASDVNRKIEGLYYGGDV